jgi:hypothetical protein
VARAAADRVRMPTHPPSTRIMIVRIGLGLRLRANSRPVSAMPSPLMNIWDATFKEKAAGGRADAVGSRAGAWQRSISRHLARGDRHSMRRFTIAGSARRTRGPTSIAQLHAGTSGTPSRSRVLHCDDINAAMCEPLNNLAIRSTRGGDGVGPVYAQPLGERIDVSIGRRRWSRRLPLIHLDH